MAKIKAKLRSMDLRGETTSTRWGDVTFSREGLAELEVDEADLPLLAGLKWLTEEQATPQEVPEPATDAVELPPPPASSEEASSEPDSPSGGDPSQGRSAKPTGRSSRR